VHQILTAPELCPATWTPLTLGSCRSRKGSPDGTSADWDFISVHAAEFGVRRLCGVLGGARFRVPRLAARRSGPCRAGGGRDRTRARGGVPRVHAEPRSQGRVVNRNRTAGLIYRSNKPVLRPLVESGHHSSAAFARLCRHHDVRRSMGKVGSRRDNASAECPASTVLPVRPRRAAPRLRQLGRHRSRPARSDPAGPGPPKETRPGTRPALPPPPARSMQTRPSTAPSCGDGSADGRSCPGSPARTSSRARPWAAIGGSAGRAAPASPCDASRIRLAQLAPRRGRRAADQQAVRKPTSDARASPPVSGGPRRGSPDSEVVRVRTSARC
jgi:hypothetical protein